MSDIIVFLDSKMSTDSESDDEIFKSLKYEKERRRGMRSQNFHEVFQKFKKIREILCIPKCNKMTKLCVANRIEITQKTA